MTAIPPPNPDARHDDAACKRKRRYSTKKSARRRGDFFERKGVPTLRVYACPFGDHWHLTKMEQVASMPVAGQPA